MTLVASYKQQAVSDKLCKAQAASLRQIVARHYVARYRQQASSFKQGWFESFINFQGASDKHQAPSNKHQAASRSR
jgi:hypothetical protein